MIFNNIYFDIHDGIDEDNIKKLFEEFLNNVNEKDISYIEICDQDQGYIFIEKEGKEDEWDEKTIQICNLLNLLSFDAFLSEEDYGYKDVIVLNNIF